MAFNDHSENVLLFFRIFYKGYYDLNKVFIYYLFVKKLEL